MHRPHPSKRRQRSLNGQIAQSRLIESLEQRRLLSVSWTIDEGGNIYNEGSGVLFSADPDDNGVVPSGGAYSFTWAAFLDGAPIADDGPTGHPDWQFQIADLPDQGTLEVHLSVTEIATSSSTTAPVLLRTVANVPPSFSFVSPSPGTITEGEPFEVFLIATDQGPQDLLTYSVRVAKRIGGVFVLQYVVEGSTEPSGVSTSISVGVPDEGEWAFIARVHDDVTFASASARLFDVVNAPPEPIVSGAPADNVEVGQIVNLTVDPNDPGASNSTLYPTPPYAWAVSPSDHDDTYTYEWTITRDGDVMATGTDPFVSFTADEPGDYHYSVTVTDNAGDFGQATGTFTAVEAQEDQATISYTGLQYFSTASNSEDTAEITLRATLTAVGADAVDASADIGTAQVAFSVYHPVNGLVYTCQVGVISGDGINGVASDTFTYALSDDADSLTVVVEVVGGGYTAEPVAIPLTVSLAETGRVVGAGWLQTTSSSGLMAGASDSRTQFSFNARRTSMAISGAFSMTYEGVDGNTYSVASTAMTSLFTWVDSGLSRAAMSATVDVYQVRRSGGPLLVHSGLTLEVSLADGGNGGFDRAGFSVWNPATGALMFASHTDATNSVTEQILSSGNIQIWES